MSQFPRQQKPLTSLRGFFSCLKEKKFGKIETPKHIQAQEFFSMEKILLSVAGYDPTAGAGVSLDIRIFQSFGYQGMGIVTSLTVQNTLGVRKIHRPPARFIWNQYHALREEVEFSGIKVGMVGCQESINPVLRILADNPNTPRIIDPVFKSSAGDWLLEKESIPIFMKKIRRRASLITPNLEEAELISGMKIGTVAEMKKAAQKIFEQTKIPCLIKGGHLQDQNIDILYDGYKFLSYKNRKLKKKVHGTGCFLSSVLLCYMAKGLPLDQANALAIQATHEAIKNATKTGKGQGIFSL